MHMRDVARPACHRMRAVQVLNATRTLLARADLLPSMFADVFEEQSVASMSPRSEANGVRAPQRRCLPPFLVPFLSPRAHASPRSAARGMRPWCLPTRGP